MTTKTTTSDRALHGSGPIFLPPVGAEKVAAVRSALRRGKTSTAALVIETGLSRREIARALETLGSN